MLVGWSGLVWFTLESPHTTEPMPVIRVNKNSRNVSDYVKLGVSESLRLIVALSVERRKR